MIRALCAGLLAIAPAPASADWLHKDAGIDIPKTIDGLRRGKVTDLSKGQKLDVMAQYGSATEPVTIYVYRSSFPNAGLWFERTLAAMRGTVGAFDATEAPVETTLLGAAQPNALRQSYTLSKAPWTATSIAIVHHGEWLVKVRISSQTLDRAGVDARMAGVLAAMHARTRVDEVAIARVDACGSEADYPPALGETTDPQAHAAATITGVIAMAEARGGMGLVKEPAKWCRPAATLPPEMASVFRQRDGSSWVALIGDSGMSASALAAPAIFPGAKAAVFFHNSAGTHVLSAVDAVPRPEHAVEAQIAPFLQGKRAALGMVSTTKR